MGNELASVDELEAARSKAFPKQQLASVGQLEAGAAQAFGPYRKLREKAERDAENFMATGGSTTRFSFSDTMLPGTELERKMFLDAVRQKTEARTVEELGGDPGFFRSLGRGVEDVALGGAAAIVSRIGSDRANQGAAALTQARQIIQGGQGRDEVWWERGLQNIPRMLPAMALALGSGGSASAIGVYAMQEYPNALVSGLDAGLTMEQAQATGAVTAIATGWLEEKMLSTKSLAGFAPAAKAGAREAAKSFLMESIRKGAFEFGEEQVQGLSQIAILGAARALAGQEGGEIAVGALEQMADQVKQMPETAISTFGMAGMGQTVQSYRDHKASPDSMSSDIRDYLDSTRTSREAANFSGVPVRDEVAAQNAEGIREKRAAKEQANAEKAEAEAMEKAREIHEYERTPEGFAEMHPARVPSVLALIGDLPPSRKAFQEAVGLDQVRLNAEGRLRFVQEIEAMQPQQEATSDAEPQPSKGERKAESEAQQQEFARQTMREQLIGYDIPANAIAALDTATLDQMIASDGAVREFVNGYDAATQSGDTTSQATKRAAAQVALLSGRVQATPVEQPTEIRRQESVKAEQVAKVLDEPKAVEDMSPGELQAAANQIAELLETEVPKAPKGQPKKKRQNFLRNFIREKRNELLGRRQKEVEESKSPRGDLKKEQVATPAKAAEPAKPMTLDDLNDLADVNADRRGDPQFEDDLRKARIELLEQTPIDSYKPLEDGDAVRFTPPRSGKKKWGKAYLMTVDEQTGERTFLVHVTDQSGNLKERPKGKQKGKVEYMMPEAALERPKGVQVQQDNWQEMRDVFGQGSDDYKAAIKAATRVRNLGEAVADIPVSADPNDRINSMAASAGVKAGLRDIEHEMGLKDGTLDSMAMRALHEPDVKAWALANNPEAAFYAFPDLADQHDANMAADMNDNPDAYHGGGMETESASWDDDIPFFRPNGMDQRMDTGPAGLPSLGIMSSPNLPGMDKAMAAVAKADATLDMNEALTESLPDEAMEKGIYTTFKKLLYGTAADKKMRLAVKAGQDKATAHVLVAENLARKLRTLIEKQYPIITNKRGDFKKAGIRQAQQVARDEAVATIHYAIMTQGKLTDPQLPPPPKIAQRMDALGPEIRDMIKLMRQEIDAASLEGMGLQMIPAPMKKTFFENMGSYLHRSYKLFDPAENWNYNTLREKYPDTLKGGLEWVMETYERKPTETAAEHRDRSVMILKTMLDPTRAMDWLTGNASIGGISTTSLINRKFNPITDQKIMDAMGYVRDPSEAFLRTRELQVQMIQSYRMQENLANIGKAMGIFHDQQTHPNQVKVFKDDWSIHKDDEGNVESARPNINKKFYPLRNLWMSRGAAEAMQDLLLRNNGKEDMQSTLIKMAASVYSFGKFMQVPLSPDSYPTNFIGGGVTEFANGRLALTTLGVGVDSGPLTIGIKNWLRKTHPGWTKGDGKPHDTTYYQSLDQMRGEDWNQVAQMLTPEAMEHIGTREGIIGQSIHMNEMLMDQRVGAVDEMRRREKPMSENAYKRLKRFIGEIYGASDNAWKYNAFLHEAKVLAKAYPDLPMSQIFAEAGDKVKATTQMFDMIPEGVRTLSMFQIMPTYVSFRLELFRNVANTVKIGIEETRSDNGAIRKHGWLRLASMTASVGAAYAGIQMLMNAIRGVDEEEDAMTDENRQDLQRWTVAPWDRDEQLGWMNYRKGDTVRYINTSYLIPQSEVASVMQAVMDGENPMDAAINGVARLGKGFFGEGVLFGAAANAIKEYHRHDQNVKLPGVGKPEVDQFAATVGSLVGDVFMPGVVKKVQRMEKQGWFGEQDEQVGTWGRVYSRDEEMWRLISMRPMETDLKDNARWRIYDFHKRVNDMEVRGNDDLAAKHIEDYKEFTRAMLRTYGMTPDDIRYAQLHTGSKGDLKVDKRLRYAAEEVFEEADRASKSK